MINKDQSAGANQDGIIYLKKGVKKEGIVGGTADVILRRCLQFIGWRSNYC